MILSIRSKGDMQRCDVVGGSASLRARSSC